jgi:hypothetical protein
MFGDPARPDTLVAQGMVQVAESDLVNLPVVSHLYRIMRIVSSGLQTNGKGSAGLSLDASALAIERVEYFNRGVQIRAPRIRFANVWALPDSAVEGTALGIARPLKDINLPILADADRIMAALQKDVTAVELSGTARNMKVSQKALSDLGEGLRRFLLGTVESERQKK